MTCIVGMLFFTTSIYAVPKISTGSGNWNSASSWSPSGVPASGDLITISAGHTITVNNNTAAIASLTVSGTLNLGNNSTNRTITVTGNIIINGGGIFRSAGDGGNVLYVRGSITNNGTFDMNVGSADATVVFDGNVNQVVSGAGATTDFSDILLSNTGATNNNTLEISSSHFTADAGFLSLNQGIFKLSGTFSITNTFFNSASPTINSDEGFWLNNPNAIITAQSGSTGLSGSLRITAGTYNVGTTASHRLIYNSGAAVNISGGELNISGAFYGDGAGDVISYQQSGGVVSVCSVGNNSFFDASFEIYAAASTFNMSGGRIILEKPATFVSDYINYSSNSTVTGGTIQAGGLLTVASSVFWVNSTPSLYNLEVNGLNNPYFQLRSNTQVINDVTIGGILDASSQNASLTVGGNWINNGVFLSAASAPVSFTGNSPQVIGGLMPTTFNNVVFNNSSGAISLGRTTSIATNATFSAGIVTSTATTPLVFLDNATASGANNNSINPSYVHGPVRKVGNDAFTFPVGKSGSGYHPCSISAPLLATDIFTAEYIRGSAGSLGSITSPGLHHVSNCDYWDIDRTLGLSPVNVTLSWNGSSNCNTSAYVTQLSSLVVAHFNGTSWNTHGASSSSGSSASGSVTRNNCSSFSLFALGSTSAASNPLPVKLSSVVAYPVNSVNRIEWTNETESAVLEYKIEKAGVGQQFETVTTFFPKTNNGSRNSYSFDDGSIFGIPQIWYRIKVTETNGNVKYSTIVKVSRQNTSTGIIVYPNPIAGRQLSVQMNNLQPGRYGVSVFDQSARLITSFTWDHQGGVISRSIELPESCAPGIYIINIRGTGESFVQRLIIN